MIKTISNKLSLTVDTAEVQHAKAKHFQAVSEAKAKAGYHGHYAPAAPAYYHQAPAQYYVPAVNHHGVPEDTYEVKAEKAKHFALVAEAQAKASSHGASYYGNGHEDDGSYDANRYEKEQYYH